MDEYNSGCDTSPASSVYNLAKSSSFDPRLDYGVKKQALRPYTSFSKEEHLATIESLQGNGFSNGDAILALPNPRIKSQRPLAIDLAALLWPEMTEIAAIIEYERVTLHGKAVVRLNKRRRLKEELRRTTNTGGRLVKVQGPWAGQELDPVDLRGPAAIPMPVEIGKKEDFEPIFRFLAQDVVITDADESQATNGLELLWKTPLVEFKRGIVYEDGRMDLCKKVVGPTHIGKLMEALESNHQIRHFLLGNNAISTTGARRIAEFVQKHPDRMETWYLAGCHITRHGLSILVPRMIKSSSITNLWFKRNPFGPNSSLLLAELVLKTQNLRTLDLETTELGNEGTSQFIDAICDKPASLRHLYLNANGVGQKACASLAKYISSPNCSLESLFLSTNPLGDAGIKVLSVGLEKNKSLIRLTCASSGLTSNGVVCLATAIVKGNVPIRTLDLAASSTTKAHQQKFNYLDDSCIDSLKALVMYQPLRYLNLGRTVFSSEGIQEILSAAAKSELVYLVVHRVDVYVHGMTVIYEGEAPARSCSLEVGTRMVKNQKKYYPRNKDYDEFLNSEDFRFLRNTSDVRKIDSMYRTLDKRLGLPMDAVWEEGDPTWKLIAEDAETAEREFVV
ncbi:hypothetical protein HYFRA_00000170 [Hymenoscyphus fraxineus]|uniref:RNI-like protein n=1 Tax=Hymenoscyphus fraxineus TaxID=746836 RepID=A0A9N9PW18_9HELO|nr:hypothetical protein HYFRA_00000170 [Hymenoscyphus fraxineus]